MRNKILKIFTRVLKLKKIIKNPKQNKIKNWDSITHLNLIFALEEELKIKFNDKEMIKIKSFEEACKIIKKKKNV